MLYTELQQQRLPCLRLAVESPTEPHLRIRAKIAMKEGFMRQIVRKINRRRRAVALCGVSVGLSLASVSPGNAAPPVARLAGYVFQSKIQNAVALPAGVERVTSVEGITEYRLPNGLRVLLFPDASKQTVTVNITYLVGARNENYGETGMAHLLEHLMFKGSPKHADPKSEMDAHGATWNGTTSYDRTNYFETFPASDANLEWAIDMEADRMVNSKIAKSDLDSEMTVVRNEYESGENSPTSILMERAMSAAYLWHHYGKSVIGARADIENVPIDRLKAFWERHYQPDNAVLLIAGKMDEEKTLALIASKFSPIPKPTRVLQKTYTEEPAQDGERMVTLRRVGDIQAVCAVYHVPAGAHPDTPSVDVLAQILADTPSGRLYKSLVEPKLASSLFGFNWSLREPSVLVLMAQVPKDKPIETTRAAFMKTVDGLTTTPPTPEEVERAKAQIIKQIDLQLRSSESVGLALSEAMAQGDWRLLFLWRDGLKKVTQADVARVAKAYLKPDNRTVGLFLPTANPDRATIPATPDVAALVKDYKGGAAIAAGEVFDPSPANIDARTELSQVSGLKLALLPKKTRGNTVVANLTLRMGSAAALKNRVTAGELAGSMLMRGTTQHTRQQIQDAFDALKANVSVDGGPTSAFASIRTTRENLPGALKLVAEILRAPSFPASEFATLKQEEVTGIEAQKSDPQALAGNALARHMKPYPKDDVRYVPTLDESIARLKAATLDDVKAFYTNFYGASAGELAVVGDFDAAEVKKLAGDLFGDWKSKTPYVRVASPYQAIAATNDTIDTPDKANAIFLASLPVKLRDDNPDYAALELANYILGGSTGGSRLWNRIREKEGLSYGVGSFVGVSPEDEAGTFTTYAIANPQNVAKVEAAFKEEVSRALKDGFTADELAKAKQGFLQARQVARTEDGALSGKLAAYRHLNRTLAFDAALETNVQSLTPEQVAGALRKYIKPGDISIIKGGDLYKYQKTGATAPKSPAPPPAKGATNGTAGGAGGK